jgi:hypothetical protein
MKTAQLQIHKCLSCGSTIAPIEDGEKYACKKCGELYDIAFLSKIELELEEYDRLVLLDLKRRRAEKKHPDRKYYYLK